MATKTFSSRVDEAKLNFADALTKQEYGISFGQYCGTILIDAIERTGRVPNLDSHSKPNAARKQAFSFIKNFASKTAGTGISNLSDAEIKELIASRYE